MVRSDIAFLSGDGALPLPGHRLLRGQVHLQGHRPWCGHGHPAGRCHHRAARDHDLAECEVDLLPHFPVRRRLRRRAAVRPGRRQGWPAASDFLGGPLRVLPGYSRRGREGRRIRRGLRGGAVRGIADDLGLDGPRDGRHQPTRLTHGPSQRPPRRDADRLRRKLYLWHRRLGDRDRAGGAGVAPHQPSCRLQGLRRKGGRRQGAGRRRFGLAPLGDSRVRSAGELPGRGPPGHRGRALVPDARVFILRIRRDGKIEEASADTVLRKGDVVALVGARDVLLKLIGAGAKEVEDPELLSVPVEGVDVYVTNKAVDGKTLAELAQRPTARGVFLRRITRGAVATSIPILPNTKINRGDILTLVGRTQDTSADRKSTRLNSSHANISY